MTPAGRGLASRLAGLSALFGACATACADREPVFVGWPAEIDVALVVVGDETRVENLGSVAFDERGHLGDALAVPLPDDDRNVQLLGWSKSELLAALPELDPTEWWTIEAVEDLEVCASGSISSDRTRRRPLAGLAPHAFNLERGTLSFTPGLVPARALERFALEYPLRPMLCDAQLPARWARLDTAVFPPGVVVDGRVRANREAALFVFNRVVRIDSNRVVTLGIDHLFHLRRDVVFGDTPAENLPNSLLPAPPASVPSEGAWWFTGAAIDPRSRERDVRTMLVTAIYVIGPAPSARGGGVFEIDVGEDGFVLPVRTSTVFWGGIGYPEALTVDADGGWVAVGSTGLILTRESDTGRVRRESVAPMPWFRRIISTAHPRARHLAGSEEGFVAFGDLRGALDRITVRLPTEAATSVRGLVSVPGPRPRALINTFASGAMELGEDGTWTRLGFQTMGQLGCASVPDGCGFRTLGAGPLASEREGTVYSFSDRCGDLTAVDLEYRCAGAVGFGLENMTDLNATDGVLTVVGEGGVVLEMFLE